MGWRAELGKAPTSTPPRKKKEVKQLSAPTKEELAHAGRVPESKDHERVVALEHWDQKGTTIAMGEGT